ncbi:MAG: terminase small subunit [Clostridia bacterium]|nr:terminase small subunit [Clostridia bacterium]
MKDKKLSKKERLFCLYFSSMRNAREAACSAGYVMPFASGAALLQKESIKKEIERLSTEKNVSDEVGAGFRRLAFGSPADCIKLLFREEMTDDELEKLDLFNLSEIKKAKNGSIEIKFFDRIKAMEHLSACENAHESDEALPFYEAIRKGADAINGVRFDE